MSYTKTTWQNGDIITAEKLNHIEDGISNNVMLINMTFDNEAVQLKSNILFSNVVSAFISGVEIVVHIPKVAEYSVTESYLHLLAYEPEDTYFNREEQFRVNTDASSVVTKLYADDQGYFCGEIYID